MNGNKLLLLHGPPGTGKTSLCRALAQKLTIRLNDRFTRGKLVELNTNALLSKWFGESGKLVSKTFDEIVQIALGESETNLVCVLVDEVETLVGVRGSSGEVGDALRATNQVLTALDMLRSRSNIIVLCTSNLLEAIDPAFLDRVDVQQYIPNPSADAAYDILRSTIHELLRSQIILLKEPRNDRASSQTIEEDDSTTLKENDFTPITVEYLMSLKVDDWPKPDGMKPPKGQQYAFPSLARCKILYFDEPESFPQRLWRIAQRCEVRCQTKKKAKISLTLELPGHEWP